MVAEIFKNEETLFLKWYLKGLNLNEAIRAVNIAEEYHGGVYRKSGEPYISHPIRIASALISLGVKAEWSNEIYYMKYTTWNMLHEISYWKYNGNDKGNNKYVWKLTYLFKQYPV